MNRLVKDKDEKIHDLNQKLLRSGITGLLKGTLIGIISGVIINYRYNRGLNKGFFKTPYKISYLICWGFAGIIFDTDNAKTQISRQLTVEEEVKRNMYFQGK